MNKNNITDKSPFYLVESFCNLHDSPAKFYCVECNRYVCDTCFNKEHRQHNFKFYDKSSVDKLIRDNKALVEKLKILYKNLEIYFNDMMKSLRNKFTELMDMKIKNLTIKENLIKDLELYKNNINLIESVAELKFEDIKIQSLKYNTKFNWKTKLDVIFEYLN